MGCSICGNAIEVTIGGWSEGNNAQPVNDGRCCDWCNWTVVVPARLKSIDDMPDDREMYYNERAERMP
jgi:hypothetical protein